jgi:hypothetical protein
VNLDELFEEKSAPTSPALKRAFFLSLQSQLFSESRIYFGNRYREVAARRRQRQLLGLQGLI